MSVILAVFTSFPIKFVGMLEVEKKVLFSISFQKLALFKVKVFKYFPGYSHSFPDKDKNVSKYCKQCCDVSDHFFNSINN